MKGSVFEDELRELGGYVATVDELLAIFADRITFLEKLKTRAVNVQAQMQRFCEMLAENETAAQAAEIDAAATHEAPPLAS